MENITENEDSLNTEEEETSKNDEQETDEKDYKALYENQKVRAEKAEKALKTKPETKETPKQEEDTTSKNESQMSLKDIRALNDVHDDDVDDILDYAEYKKISPAEAKKTPAMTSLLGAKAEERKTAEAANVGGSKKGSSKISVSDLVRRAETKGELPESDADLDRMLEDRYSIKS